MAPKPSSRPETRRRLRRTVLCSILLLPAAAVSIAKEVEPAAREVRAIRVTAAPVIDGKLDDESWSLAPEITGLTQRDPKEGEPASEKTVIRIVYDDNAIYIGARMDDSKGVASALGRRDNYISQSDWLRVFLDPHHDHRTGSGFWVNPANVQIDSLHFNDTWDDWDWDAVWSSATSIDAGGWTAEMRIPFSQLRFPDRPEHVWGINITRNISRNNEHASLVFVPKNESGFVSRFAHLTGISGIQHRRMFELLPYTVARTDLRGTVSPADPLNERNFFGSQFGLDLKYGITPNLTLTGAMNPDFGQVEDDPASINLSQFELFYNEKRPFFVEGSNLFRFGEGGSNWNMSLNLLPPDFFYSRRIGRTPQAAALNGATYADAPHETTILGAAKISGKTASGWSIGVLDAVTAEESGSFVQCAPPSGCSAVEERIVEPMTNYLVARASRDVGARGRFGLLFTSVNRELDEDVDHLRRNAYSGGVDGYWTWGKRDLMFEGFIGGSIVEGSRNAITLTQRAPAHYYQRPDADHVTLDPGRTSLSGWAARASLVKQTGRWRYNLLASTYSPGFETNDIGFMQRSDITATHAGVMRIDTDLGKRTRERWFMAAKYQNWNTDGDLLSNGLYSEGSLLFLNYWSLGGSLSTNLERYDDRATRGGPLVRQPTIWSNSIWSSTDSRKPLSFQISQSNSGNAEGSFEHRGSVGITYRPSTNLRLKVEPKYATSRAFAQYVGAYSDPSATQTYGRRYIFGSIDQNVVELATRLDWTFTSRLSLQLYLQPYIASGDYHGFKELAAPRTFDYAKYGENEIALTSEGNYRVTPPGGLAHEFANPDFNFRSVRGSAVLRWEFRPGSAVYFAWNENRADAVNRGDFDFGRDLSAITDIDSDDVFLVKVSYWLPI